MRYEGKYKFYGQIVYLLDTIGRQMSWHQRAGMVVAVEVNRFMKELVSELDKGKVGWIVYLGLLFSIIALVWYLVDGTSLVISAALGMLVVIFAMLGLFYPVWRWLR